MKISKSDRQTTVDRHHQLEAAVDLAIAQLGDLTQSSDAIDRLDLAFGSNWNRTQGLRLLQRVSDYPRLKLSQQRKLMVRMELLTVLTVKFISVKIYSIGTNQIS
jgi:hypothetical protein